LVNGGMLTIDGQNFGPGSCGQLDDPRPTDDKGFLIGKRHRLARFECRHRAMQPCRADDGCEDHIDRLRLYQDRDRVRPVEELRSCWERRPIGSVKSGFIRQDGGQRLELPALLREFLPLRMGHQPDDLNTVWPGERDIQRARAYRPRRPQHHQTPPTISQETPIDFRFQIGDFRLKISRRFLPTCSLSHKGEREQVGRSRFGYQSSILNRQSSMARLGRDQLGFDGLPVDGVPPGVDVARAQVLVLQVVGMFPDVDAEHGDQAFH
jgi:hypothetical protein